MRAVIAGAVLAAAACGPGNDDHTDYAPPALEALGIHNAPEYVAKDVLPTYGIGVMLAHPLLGQPAIRVAGEPFDVGWIAPDPTARGAEVSLGDTILELSGTACDAVGVCHAIAVAPALQPGLYPLCVQIGSAEDCSRSALAIVDHYDDPITIVHVSDAHCGDGHSCDVFGAVIAAINAVNPDLVIFTGDGANSGAVDERIGFIDHVAELTVPAFIVTGNHDYDNTGLDGWLLDIGPELDYAASYGAFRLIALSSGQDLDDGDHDTTISESSGPDRSQLDWLEGTLDTTTPTVAFFHHPIYNALFATIGPDSRDRLKDDVTRDNMRAVLSGHTHISAVFDADGNSRGLSVDAEDDVDPARWPLHYIASRATNGTGGFAILHIGTSHVDYRWHALP